MIIRSLVVLLVIEGVVFAVHKCSLYCTCSMWEGLKRADCTRKNLVDVITDVPENVEVLNLAFNSIRSLEDNTFQVKLSSLKQLNLSRNHIQHVAMKAFEGLKQLKTLDLSQNHIKYLVDGIFLRTPQLETLLLSGNDFSMIGNEPLLEATSLKVLYISNCRIDHLKFDVFTKVPNLVGLDLSGNYLAQLDIRILSVLHNLEKLDLSRNRWQCNNRTNGLTTWLTQRNIEFTAICTDREEESKDRDEFSIEPPFDDVETIDVPWSEDKDDNKNGQLNVQTKHNETYILEEKFKFFFYITHLFDAIPSFWAFLIGFQVGVVITICGSVLFWKRPSSSRRDPPVHRRWSLRRSVRVRSMGSTSAPWTELQSFDCPDTPPPPYKDINTPRNNVRLLT